MKFSLAVVTTLLCLDSSLGFVPASPLRVNTNSRMYMAADMPPAAQSDIPVVQQNAYGQPTDVRYSDFLKLINADRIEKVTFSADGTQLLGVDVDGARVKIEALPNDPDLLTSLTNHKVCRRAGTLVVSWVSPQPFSHVLSITTGRCDGSSCARSQWTR